MTALAHGLKKVKVKFMLGLENPAWRILRYEAKQRGIKIQELLRAMIIPEWLEKEKAKERRKRKKR